MGRGSACKKRRISNIEHGISNDEVFSLCHIASAFDIFYSIFDILFWFHAEPNSACTGELLGSRFGNN
jgi:hypothetical protein